MARQYVCNKNYPVVDTKAGKIRGFLLDGIFNFYGVEYARAARFQMPEPVEPWEGTKDATAYGAVAPTYGDPVPSGEHFIPHRFWPSSENCQNLNIWTRSLDPEAKRPVVVWYHGGGYANGSSIEQVAYEGDALCEYGDVVVVTVNHRLNILGFLDMSSFGEKYANSGNAGMADIVASLQWIHENIAGFGGDPENVTIFGQSGGGGKVVTLLQTPAATGLFHKAIMMSGGAGSMKAYGREATDHRPVIEGMMTELGIPVTEPERLEKVPYNTLMKAYYRVVVKTGINLNWAPRANEWYLGHPVEVGFSENAKKIPTIVSTVFAEFSAFGGLTGVTGVTRESSEEEKIEAMKALFGEDTERFVELFKKAYPEKDILLLTQLDRSTRQGAQIFMNERAASEPSAPGYNYVLGLEFEVNDGTPAWHCSDIPFVFYNTHRVGNCNIEGVTEQLEEEMAGMLVSFAYTGNPNHPGMPKWEPYTLEKKATMVFDRTSECKIGYDEELIDGLMEKLGRPVFNFMRIPDEDGNRGDWLY